MVSEAVRRALAEAPAHEVMAWVAQTFKERAALSCSFGGPGGIVLAHMAAQLEPKIPILFLDTGFLFPQTHALKERVEREWGLNVLTARPRLSPEEQQEQYGPALWTRDPDLCCRLRKVEPMKALLRSFDCWVSSIRRDQSSTRAGAELIETHVLDDGREIIKVNPLIHWTRRDVWAYIAEHNLPYNTLLDEGYTSLGCVQCTRRAAAEGDERAGRWPGTPKTECGLHTFTRLRMETSPRSEGSRANSPATQGIPGSGAKSKGGG